MQLLINADIYMSVIGERIRFRIHELLSTRENVIWISAHRGVLFFWQCFRGLGFRKRIPQAKAGLVSKFRRRSPLNRPSPPLGDRRGAPSIFHSC